MRAGNRERLGDFVQVGLALATIKEKELYRTAYGSFEQYCRDKRQYSERYAYQLMSAAQVFRHLCANCTEHKPCHESRDRPLAGLTVEQACSACNQAVDIGVGDDVPFPHCMTTIIPFFSDNYPARRKQTLDPSTFFSKPAPNKRLAGVGLEKKVRLTSKF